MPVKKTQYRSEIMEISKKIKCTIILEISILNE